MEHKLTLDDLFSFIKNNIKYYIISFIVVVFAVIGISVYSSLSQDVIDGEDADNSLFSFILENKQGNIMNNSGAVKEALLTSLSKDQKLYQEYSNLLEVNYDNVKNIIIVSLSEVEKEDAVDQEKITDFFMNEIKNDSIDFFNDKGLYFVSYEPLEEVGVPNSESNLATGFSKKKIILLVGITIILTAVTGTILSSYMVSKDKKITQKFYLGSGFPVIDINSLKFDTLSEKIDAIKAIVNRDNKAKLILVEDEDLQKQLEKSVSDQSNTILNSLLNENAIKTDNRLPEEILIICSKDRTTKKWLKIQKELSDSFEVNVKYLFI